MLAFCERPFSDDLAGVAPVFVCDICGVPICKQKRGGVLYLEDPDAPLAPDSLMMLTPMYVHDGECRDHGLGQACTTKKGCHSETMREHLMKLSLVAGVEAHEIEAELERPAFTRIVWQGNQPIRSTEEGGNKK